MCQRDPSLLTAVAIAAGLTSVFVVVGSGNTAENTTKDSRLDTEIPTVAKIVDEVVLPQNLRWASDVRWETKEKLFLAAGKEGVVTMDRTSQHSAALIPGGGGDGCLWFAHRVGVSNELLVGAAPFFSVVFEQRDRERPSRNRSYAAILDLDVSNSSALILGAVRDDAGRWAPDGAMAWLDDGKADARPVHYLSGDVDKDAVSRCGIVDVGACKIMSDSSFVIVPGVDSGVFWYAADGKLKRAWQSAKLGIAGECKLDDEEKTAFAQKLEPRINYWNSHVLVEDVIEIGTSPALLIRKRDQKSTLWEILFLGSDGVARRLKLPIRSPSGLTRARADVRGNDLVILLHESGQMDVPPDFEPRLIFLEFGS